MTATRKAGHFNKQHRLAATHTCLLDMGKVDVGQDCILKGSGTCWEQPPAGERKGAGACRRHGRRAAGPGRGSRRGLLWWVVLNNTVGEGLGTSPKWWRKGRVEVEGWPGLQAACRPPKSQHRAAASRTSAALATSTIHQYKECSFHQPACHHKHRPEKRRARECVSLRLAWVV